MYYGKATWEKDINCIHIVSPCRSDIKLFAGDRTPCPHCHADMGLHCREWLVGGSGFPHGAVCRFGCALHIRYTVCFDEHTAKFQPKRYWAVGKVSYGIRAVYTVGGFSGSVRLHNKTQIRGLSCDLLCKKGRGKESMPMAAGGTQQKKKRYFFEL